MKRAEDGGRHIPEKDTPFLQKLGGRTRFFVGFGRGISTKKGFAFPGKKKVSTKKNGGLKKTRGGALKKEWGKGTTKKRKGGRRIHKPCGGGKKNGGGLWGEKIG